MKKQTAVLWILTIASSLFITCNTTEVQQSIAPGTSRSLADLRKQNISDVTYELSFVIPETLEEEIEGAITVRFDRLGNDDDLVLDFKGKQVLKVLSNDKEVPIEFKNEHIVVSADDLQDGKNEVGISFVAGEQALNRNEEFMYALFVPDKASTAFPCFDQPNIKARYKLMLGIPRLMTAFANYSIKEVNTVGDVAFYEFNETLPISTYLFSFGVGYFESITKTLDGREMTLYHRETDETKVARNANLCFDLHAKSLAWLEDYTGISYPFEQFNFALIPAFQFGGMEHPGAIWYKARSLFLEENATVNQKMGRNSLIAHETAHMWFGDLVTMDWFDDVWLKEVYANFMAAKMVNPNFPEIDHDLRFLLRHQPSAYGEDRSAGSHAVQQPLDNLNEASLLYGRIIYQKAPVVMKQLESIIGESKFQEGLQEYLKTYQFGNATWDDLINILDKRTDLDLSKWSRAWVKESGMPHYQSKVTGDTYSVDLQNKTSGNNIWQQNSVLAISKNNEVTRQPISLFDANNSIKDIQGIDDYDFIIPHASEQAYGYFELDKKSVEYLITNVATIDDNLVKSAAWFSLWEGCIRNDISADQLYNAVIGALPLEKDVQGLATRLGYLRTLYWGFFNKEERERKSEAIETMLLSLMNKTSDNGQKKLFFDSYIAMVETPGGVQRMKAWWDKSSIINGLNLSENDFSRMAYALAVREVSDAQDILNKQLQNIINPDRKAEMEFVIPALSSDQNERDAFFEKLKDINNRGKESWILTALQYLHHPLRASASEKYIKPSLELVQEIQQTGSIFFPQRWMGSTLVGHRSSNAAAIFNEFVASLPKDYPLKLKNKILMQGDLLTRKAGFKN